MTLKSQINSAMTGTCTAMGAGLQTALTTLSSSTNKRFAILCTDGMQNIEPKLTAVGGGYEIIDSGGWQCGGHSSTAPQPGVDIASYNAPVHTIGIGITATYSALLQDVANHTGAFFEGTNDPATDLDLIYFVDLTNVMAAGSPAIIHYNAGRLHKEECDTHEHFYVNESARKLTVILSTQESQNAQLTFWLHAPDGTRLNLHSEMKLFANYSMATIYLPWDKPNRVSHVGRWTMVIGGDFDGSTADYHAIAIAEDHETKINFRIPPGAYMVGDTVPIIVTYLENGKPVIATKDATVEICRLPQPPADLLAEYDVSVRELGSQTQSVKGRHPQAELAAKLQKMEADPRLQKLLRPVCKTVSISKGTLAASIVDGETVLSIPVDSPGLWTFKVTVRAETDRSGPVMRSGRLSVIVGPGKVDREQSSVSVTPANRKGVYINVTPRSDKGFLFGPGHADGFQFDFAGKAKEIRVEDFLDGAYRLDITDVDSDSLKECKVSFQDTVIWAGSEKN